MTPPIHIIGAGIGGLTLARCFRNRGIQAVIFEKNPSPAKHNYGISLQPWAWRLLVKELGIEEGRLLGRVAVDGDGDGGSRGLKYLDSDSRSAFGEDGRGVVPLRAHRGRLEGLLREGLEGTVRWGHVLRDVEMGGDGNGIGNRMGGVLRFEDKPDIRSLLVVDTSGVHSSVRKSLLPATELNVLPYVVFRGTRRIERKVFEEVYEAAFERGTVLKTRVGEVLLQIWIDDVKEEGGRVDLSIVYSRPSKDNDPLHRPGRDLSQASDISEAFFEEVSKLSLQGLGQPWKDAFAVDDVRKARTLHWLMRDVLVERRELDRLGREGVVFIGDSAHALPILGGEGANFAIRDAVELAGFVEESLKEGKELDVSGFYGKMFGEWKEGIRAAEERLRDIHAGGKSSL
ncbi:uncharacterized protein RCO7_02096 [Rhynchosporium graminicola]|uniref:FAD-binding domain-containing protein n=1 Tax=Rhynchosporium graminicola TaxID=2792576 RepID=A0A1E1KTR9_9HELO|nr:uncharacterized protein RCO7_02096 [Rhynchosporium commune]